MKEDIVSSYEAPCDGMSNRLTNSKWYWVHPDNCACLYILVLDDVPKLHVSITIDKGLLEQVSKCGLKLTSETLDLIVGNENKLAYWSQFDA